MTTGIGHDEFARHRDRLLVALIARHAEPPLRWSGPGRLTFAAGSARVAVSLSRPDAPHASLRLRTVSVSYRLEGEPSEGLEGARRALLSIGETLACLEDATHATDPRELVGVARAIRRDTVADWSSPGATPPGGLPPCLDVALRPPFSGSNPGSPRPLVAPCDACGVRLHCDFAIRAASGTKGRAETTRHVEALHPLRHARESDAVDAAVDAMATRFGAPVPNRVRAFLERAYRARSTGTAHTPLELSIKLDANGLEPRLRVVDYGPVERGSASDSRTRREAVAEAVRAVASPTATGATERFLACVVERHADLGEFSIGVDAPMHVAEFADPQLYVHLDPRDRRVMQTVGREALAYAGCDAATQQAFVALLGKPWTRNATSNGTPEWPELTLVAHSPREADAARMKLYVTAPMAASHEPLGMASWEPGPFGALAPRVGLAVFETNRGRLRLRKRDFPCLEHFQRLDRVVDAFVTGAPDSTAAAVRSLLDGQRFAAWPTWLSVAGDARTLYFVPR